jgi:Glycosyl transferase family group 2
LYDVASILILASWFGILPATALAFIAYAIYKRVSLRDLDNPQPSNDDPLIVQITTIGNPTVNEIIRRIRALGLSLPFQIWVVVDEPYREELGYDPDRLIAVPREFRTQAAKFKARALEYARLFRMKMVERGELTAYKVLYLDDDSCPTKQFIEDSWYKNVDLLEGMICPGNRYGSLGSILDNIRTFTCMTVCSFFQGTSHPVWIHGESMTVSDRVDREISWDKPLVASEDLAYGQDAVAKGYKMWFTYSRVNITSPLSLKDFVRQRRRWIWGNFHAIRELLTVPQKVKLLFFYFNALFMMPVSIVAILLLLLGYIQVPSVVYALTLGGFGFWLAVWGIAGYLARFKLQDAAVSVAMALVSSMFDFGITVVALSQGPPKRFEVIRKEV